MPRIANKSEEQKLAEADDAVLDMNLNGNKSFPAQIAYAVPNVERPRHLEGCSRL